jgi:hypothetical protein
MIALPPPAFIEIMEERGVNTTCARSEWLCSMELVDTPTYVDRVIAARRGSRAGNRGYATPRPCQRVLCGVQLVERQGESRHKENTLKALIRAQMLKKDSQKIP